MTDKNFVKSELRVTASSGLEEEVRAELSDEKEEKCISFLLHPEEDKNEDS